jgi:hypothetical protein
MVRGRLCPLACFQRCDSILAAGAVSRAAWSFSVAVGAAVLVRAQLCHLSLASANDERKQNGQPAINVEADHDGQSFNTE